ncbi:MAG: hypothetical protein R3C99_04705 [Pirellulaceae bacterium]
MASRERSAKIRNRVTLILAFLILIPSMYGFVGKLLEFLQVFQGEADGVFAITPMLNYILASAGFFMLLLWATANGMFHDIERPKDRMLQNEQFLDDQW